MVLTSPNDVGLSRMKDVGCVGGLSESFVRGLWDGWALSKG